MATNDDQTSATDQTPPASTTSAAPGGGDTGVPDQPPTAPAQRQSGAAASSWHDWLTKPENQAAMMQFSINLMQPVGPGQNLMGAVGQAVGAGAEARDRAIASDAELKQKQIQLETERRAQESKSSEEEAQSQYYRDVGSARQLVAKLRSQDQVKSYSALSSTAKWLADEIQKIQTMVDPSDPQLQLYQQSLSEVMGEMHDQYLKDIAGKPGAASETGGGGGSPLKDPAGAETALKGMSTVDATAKANSLLAGGAQRASVIDVVRRAHPEIDVTKLGMPSG